MSGVEEQIGPLFLFSLFFFEFVRRLPVLECGRKYDVTCMCGAIEVLFLCFCGEESDGDGPVCLVPASSLLVPGVICTVLAAKIVEFV